MDEQRRGSQIVSIQPNDVFRAGINNGLDANSLDDDEVIPVLIFISKDESLDIKVRNRAIEILSRKNAPELVDFFVCFRTFPR